MYTLFSKASGKSEKFDKTNSNLEEEYTLLNRKTNLFFFALQNNND